MSQPWKPRNPTVPDPKKRFEARYSDEERLRQIAMIDKHSKDANNLRLTNTQRREAMTLVRSIREKHRKALAAESQAADERVWGPVEGEMLTRWEAMEYLVYMVENGYSLPEALRLPSDSDPDANMPTLTQIARWRRFHSEFNNQLSEAEEARGTRLGEEAITEIAALPEAPTREQVNRAKALSEVKAKAAARLNARYQDKSHSVHEEVDPFESMSLEQLSKRITGLLVSNPELSKALGDTLSTEHEALSMESVTSVTEESDGE